MNLVSRPCTGKNAGKKGCVEWVDVPPTRSLPCVHEGAVTSSCVTCGGVESEARHVRQCCHPGGIRDVCTRGPVSPDVQACATCAEYVAPGFEPDPKDVPVGVAIGAYKWPALIDLQIRLIRHTCGPVPILVSDDCSPPDRAARLAAICAGHPDVYLWPNATRIGHGGGDVAAFWKGVQWAKGRGLKVLAKLSQRFIVTRPRWLHDGARDLLASGLPLSTRACRGREVFDLRTEAALLDVDRWHTPEVLARISPRAYWQDVPTGRSGESVIYRTLHARLGGVFWPWSLFTEERYAPAEGTVWHCSHAVESYQQLAREYGVTLDDDFHNSGWQGELAKGTYLHG